MFYFLISVNSIKADAFRSDAGHEGDGSTDERCDAQGTDANDDNGAGIGEGDPENAEATDVDNTDPINTDPNFIDVDDSSILAEMDETMLAPLFQGLPPLL